MEFEEEILPEPFSEKNIDGSPISGSASGGSLFRSAPAQQGTAPAGRGTPAGRGISTGYGQSERRAAYAAPSGGEQNIYSAEAARIELQRAESMHHQMTGGMAATPTPEPIQTSDYIRTSVPAPAKDYAPEPVKREEPRFEPPVDEKPGMIPNPMKMPPVKVKSSIDYDYDYDSDIGNDVDYDYDYDSDGRQTAEVTASIRSTEDMRPEEDYYSETVTLDELTDVNTVTGDDSDGYGSDDFGDDDDYGMDIDVDNDDDYR